MADEVQISVVLSSIQDFPQAESLSGDDLLVVAQKVGNDWQTKSARYQQVVDSLDEKYNLDGLCSVFEAISGIVSVDTTLKIDAWNDPYIISSITYHNGMPSSLSGYRLADVLSVETVDEYRTDPKIPVAVIWFGGTSALINLPA